MMFGVEIDLDPVFGELVGEVEQWHIRNYTYGWAALYLQEVVSQ